MQPGRSHIYHRREKKAGKQKDLNVMQWACFLIPEIIKCLEKIMSIVTTAFLLPLCFMIPLQVYKIK